MSDLKKRNDHKITKSFKYSIFENTSNINPLYPVHAPEFHENDWYMYLQSNQAIVLHFNELWLQKKCLNEIYEIKLLIIILLVQINIYLKLT